MERVEEYIETIYDIQKREGRIAKTNRIAEILGVKPASVTEMLIKMAKDGYIDYQPYRGAVLTDKGLKLAEKIKKSHNIFEKFLVDFLEVPRDVAHNLSCKIEHYLPESVEKRLERFLSSAVVKLSELDEGNMGRIVAIFNPMLENIGFRIGRNITVKEKKRDKMIISFEDGEDIVVETETAKSIFVENSNSSPPD